MQPTRNTFQVSDDVFLAADAWGSLNDPTVLLFHGAGQTRHSWRDTGTCIMDVGYHVVSVDLRGHGESSWSPDGQYSLSIWAQDICTIIAEMNRTPIIIGASAGGLAGLVAVGTAKETIARGLILVDVVPRVSKLGANRIVEFMRAYPDGFNCLEEAADLIAGYTNRDRAQDLAGLSKNLQPCQDGRFRWRWDIRILDDPDGEKLDTIYEETIRAAKNISIPTLLVRGENSDIVTDEGVAELQSAIPSAQYVSVPKAKHMIAGDNNNAFNDAVTQFLKANRL